MSTINEARNELKVDCCACGVEFDPQQGGSKFTDHQDRADICLCESCGDDMVRCCAFVPQFLNDDVISDEDYDRVEKWAREALVLSYVDGLAAEMGLCSMDDVRAFLNAVTAFVGGGFHPDTDFADYFTGAGTCVLLFTESAAKALNERMAEAFAICGNAKQTDLYQIACEGAQRAGWMPKGDEEEPGTRRMADEKPAGQIQDATDAPSHKAALECLLQWVEHCFPQHADAEVCAIARKSLKEAKS